MSPHPREVDTFAPTTLARLTTAVVMEVRTERGDLLFSEWVDAGTEVYVARKLTDGRLLVRYPGTPLARAVPAGTVGAVRRSPSALARVWRGGGC